MSSKIWVLTQPWRHPSAWFDLFVDSSHCISALDVFYGACNDDAIMSRCWNDLQLQAFVQMRDEATTQSGLESEQKSQAPAVQNEGGEVLLRNIQRRLWLQLELRVQQLSFAVTVRISFRVICIYVRSCLLASGRSKYASLVLLGQLQPYRNSFVWFV